MGGGAPSLQGEGLATSTPQLRQWGAILQGHLGCTPQCPLHHPGFVVVVFFFNLLLLFSCSVMSDSATSWTTACQAPLSVEDCPSKNTRAGCHFLLQGIFPTQGSNLCLVHWQEDSLHLSHLDMAKEAGGHSCHWQSLYNYLALRVVGQKDRMISLGCWLPWPKPTLPLDSQMGEIIKLLAL